MGGGSGAQRAVAELGGCHADLFLEAGAEGAEAGEGDEHADPMPVARPFLAGRAHSAT